MAAPVDSDQRPRRLRAAGARRPAAAARRGRRPPRRRAARPGRPAAPLAARRRRLDARARRGRGGSSRRRASRCSTRAGPRARRPGRSSAPSSRGARSARSLRLVIAMAIAQQPRLDVRLWMLFWELADRYGKVHPDGIHLDLPLTHEVLSHLAGARRPSVSGALTRLADDGRLRRAGRNWVLVAASRRCWSQPPRAALRSRLRTSTGLPSQLRSDSSSAAIRSGTGSVRSRVGLGRLDLAALALLAHDRLQPLAVLVLVVLGSQSTRQRLDQLDRLLDLRRLRAPARAGDAVGGRGPRRGSAASRASAPARARGSPPGTPSCAARSARARPGRSGSITSASSR